MTNQQTVEKLRDAIADATERLNERRYAVSGQAVAFVNPDIIHEAQQESYSSMKALSDPKIWETPVRENEHIPLNIVVVVDSVFSAQRPEAIEFSNIENY